jgi:hypothetical protein
MQKNKHSKVRNTGLLFEILLRQVTADILDKSKKTKALDIIKENFNSNTELGKELGLYNLLINQKFQSDNKADFFINEVLKSYAKLNKSSLRREKYNVIKEIKNNFDINKILSSKVNNYKLYASVYKLFEYNDTLSPEEKTETHFNLIENITRPVPVTKFTDIVSKSSSLDKDERFLTYKILLEKFNSKYSKLNSQQRNLIKEYINNVANTNGLNEHIDGIIPNIKKELQKYLKTVKEKIVKIKLKEAINSIDKFCDTNAKQIKDSTIIQTLRYMELLKELKILCKKDSKNLLKN